MPTEPKISMGTGCGGMQETGGTGEARSKAAENAKIEACCNVENADTFEVVESTISSAGKGTCVRLKASITCQNDAGSCYRRSGENPKL